jgi:hypothetical protein
MHQAGATAIGNGPEMVRPRSGQPERGPIECDPMKTALRHVATGAFALWMTPIAAAASVGAPPEAQILYHEGWYASLGESLSSQPGVAAKSSIGPAPTLEFDAFGQHFLALVENNAHIASHLAASRPDLAGRFRFWSGQLAGNPRSWLRLMREGTAWYGMIWDGREMYVIEPQADAAPFLVEGAANDTASHLIYRLSDTLADLGPNFCGSANPSRTAILPRRFRPVHWPAPLSIVS